MVQRYLNIKLPLTRAAVKQVADVTEAQQVVRESAFRADVAQCAAEKCATWSVRASRSFGQDREQPQRVPFRRQLKGMLRLGRLEGA